MLDSANRSYGPHRLPKHHSVSLKFFLFALCVEAVDDSIYERILTLLLLPKTFAQYCIFCLEIATVCVKGSRLLLLQMC